MSGVGDWISRFRYRTSSGDESNATYSSSSENRHQNVTSNRYNKQSRSSPKNVSQQKKNSSESTMYTEIHLEESPKICSRVRQRRRLKKATTDSENEDTLVETTSSYYREPSPCPVIASLLEESPQYASYNLEAEKDDYFSDQFNQTSHRHEPGTELVIKCLEISSNMSDDLIQNFCKNKNSEEERNHIRQYIGQGRLSLASSFNSNIIIDQLKEIDNMSSNVNKQQLFLKDYQIVGVQWLMALHKQQRFGILADEMGLGKTAQTITFLRLIYYLREMSNSSIVICPATLVDNWMIEINRWAPNLRAIKYHGSQKERRCIIRQFEDSLETNNPVHILVASLQSISSQWDRAMLFKKYNFGYLVIDEAHYLKNADSQIYRSMKKYISSKYRLLLTGSPIQNELSELQNLLLLLLPHDLTSDSLQEATSLYAEQRTHFRTELFPTTQQKCSDIQLNGSTQCMINESDSLTAEINNRPMSYEVEFLQQVFSPFILRRLKSEVINDLPTKISIVERCVLEGRQYHMYMEEISEANSVLAKELCSLSVNLNDNFPTVTPLTQPKNQELSSTVAMISQSKTKETLGPHLQKKHIQNLMFRLRRICNHPLLFKGYYTEEQLLTVINHFHTAVEGYMDKSYDRVKQAIMKWSDYEVHRAISDATGIKELSSLKLPPNEFLKSTKIRRMLEIIDDVFENKSKVLIFSQFTTYLDIIEETLQLHRRHLQYLRLDGGTVISERQCLIEHFSTNDSICIFLLSTKAGGTGLNLTAANTVLLMDQDWNPHNDRQAEDRVHRLGQTRPVTVYRLCCRGSLEETILKCAKKKLYLDEAFGGNADLLTAAILKDCFSTSLALKEQESILKTHIKSNKETMSNITVDPEEGKQQSVMDTGLSNESVYLKQQNDMTLCKENNPANTLDSETKLILSPNPTSLLNKIHISSPLQYHLKASSCRESTIAMHNTIQSDTTHCENSIQELSSNHSLKSTCTSNATELIESKQNSFIQCSQTIQKLFQNCTVTDKLSKNEKMKTDSTKMKTTLNKSKTNTLSDWVQQTRKISDNHALNESSPITCLIKKNGRNIRCEKIKSAISPNMLSTDCTKNEELKMHKRKKHADSIKSAKKRKQSE